MLAWRASSVIALTAHSLRGNRGKCLAAGCNDYLAKPIDRHILLELVGRYLPIAHEPIDSTV